jgi:hypothetical protein
VFPKRAVRPGLRSVVTAVLAPLDRGQWTGPETSAALEDGPDPQEVPDLFSWEPRLFFASGGGDLRIRWPALDVGPQTWAVEYTVEAVLADTGLPVVRVAGPQESTAAVIDARPFEDAGYQVVVVARTSAAIDGRVVELTYRSGSRQVPVRAGAAPSRGRPCLTDDLRGVLHAVEPCPLTDGDFRLHQQVSFPACPEDGSECVQTHQRQCVNLGASRPVSLVVYRTHFPYVQAVVELSADGRRFISPGPPATPADRGMEIVSVPVDPPQPATIACVRGPFTGAALQELSVW